MSDELPPPDPRDVALREMLAAVTEMQRLIFFNVYGGTLRAPVEVNELHGLYETKLSPITEALTRARAAIEEIGRG